MRANARASITSVCTRLACIPHAVGVCSEQAQHRGWLALLEILGTRSSSNLPVAVQQPVRTYAPTKRRILRTQIHSAQYPGHAATVETLRVSSDAADSSFSTSVACRLYNGLAPSRWHAELQLDTLSYPGGLQSHCKPCSGPGRCNCFSRSQCNRLCRDNSCLSSQQLYQIAPQLRSSSSWLPWRPKPVLHYADVSYARATGSSSRSRGYTSSSSSSSSVNPEKGFIRGGYTPDMFPPDRIRNFCIIAHIDHGKSTLADRLMQMTGAVPAGSRPQYLDKLQVERERGITIKAQTASLVYRHSDDGQDYLLNLIDTPGHVDFSYEVSRSLAACQGALLLVDASQGIQAQTVANFYLAFEQDLALLSVLNKVDLQSADPAAVSSQMVATFDVSAENMLQVSAKTGLGCQELLPAIVRHIPAPAGSSDAPLRLMLFDAFHDEYRGVICLVAVVDGTLKAGDKLQAVSTGQEYEALEVGILAPEPHPTGQLLTGQVGYVIPGIKEVKAARVGDTWHLARQPVEALPGFKPVKPMVFAGLYPASADDYEGLADAIERLNLNDASVTVRKETSEALGAGFRCGFLGPLHLEVFLQRLQQEHKADVISTAPTVPYELELARDAQQQQQQQRGDLERIVIESVADYPRDRKVSTIFEPTVIATIIVPQQYCGAVMKLAVQRRGSQLDYSFLGGSSSGGSSSSAEGPSVHASTNGSSRDLDDPLAAAAAVADTGGSSSSSSSVLASDRVLLRYQLPLSELAGDFYSKLKSVTQGYASFDYEEGEMRPADLTLLELLVNGKSVDALCRLVPAGDAARLGRSLASRMRELLDRQQYEVAIQAAAGGRIVARETLKALRKDVLAKCYGGDVSRKRKLLQKQKEGKKRLRQLGGMSVPAEIFPELLKP